MAGSLRYWVERTSLFLLTIYISATLVFLIPRLVPGDPLAVYYDHLREAGALRGIEEMIEEYRRMFGLDKDPLTQYFSFFYQLLRGDLGYSISSFPAKVTDLIMAALPWSVGLLLVTTIISWVLGTLLGAIGGWVKESKVSKIVVGAALFLSITPYYILAILLVFIFIYTLRWFPWGGGYSIGVMPGFSLSFIIDVMWHAFLPALSIILSSLTWWFLSMRSMLSTVKGEDFVIMAEAKGLREREVMWGYAVKNAILPQVTGLALSLSRIFAGSLITEVIFGYPGLGTLIVTAIQNLDYFLIQGTILLSIIAVATANFLIEIFYPLLDPRIRHGGG
jgi:peptide/nickel transport system permease protein